MDKLSVVGISLTTLIGTLAWEQTTPQCLLCDITFETNAKHIAQTDSIDRAIDYDVLTKAIQAFVEKHHFQLIETLAENLVSYLFSQFTMRWIKLTLHKPGALTCAQDVAITIERTPP